MRKKSRSVKVPVRGQLKLTGTRYYDRRMTVDRKRRFHDSKTGRFMPNNVVDKHAHAAYGAMNLKGRHGRSADTIAWKFGWSYSESQEAMKAFYKARGDALLGRVATPELYPFLAKYAKRFGD